MSLFLSQTLVGLDPLNFSFSKYRFGTEGGGRLRTRAFFIQRKASLSLPLSGLDICLNDGRCSINDDLKKGEGKMVDRLTAPCSCEQGPPSPSTLPCLVPLLTLNLS